MKKFAFFCSVLMSIAVLFTACPPQPGSNSEVASLELKPTEVSMKVNDVRRLSFVAKDKDEALYKFHRDNYGDVQRCEFVKYIY